MIQCGLYRSGHGDVSFRYMLPVYNMSQKNRAKLFLSELSQISISFDNFWQKDGKEATVMRDALIFHLT